MDGLCIDSSLYSVELYASAVGKTGCVCLRCSFGGFGEWFDLCAKVRLGCEKKCGRGWTVETMED